MICYLITCLINDKQYVGITKHTSNKRWRSHIRIAKAGRKAPFHCAIRAFGKDSFLVQEIACSKNWEDLEQIERLVIAQYKTQIPYGYNVTSGGDGGDTFSGRVHSEETKRRMSESRLALPDKVRRHALGQKRSPEAVQRMREAQKGHLSSIERNAKISATLTGKPGTWLGRSHSDTSKKKISESKTGKSLPTKGVPKSEEAKAAMRAGWARKRLIKTGELDVRS